MGRVERQGKQQSTVKREQIDISLRCFEFDDYESFIEKHQVMHNDLSRSLDMNFVERKLGALSVYSKGFVFPGLVFPRH